MVNKSRRQQQQQQQREAPTEKQKLRAEAKERARIWARDTLGGKNKATTAVRKSKNPISKEEAKARARKWAKERFGEGYCSDEAEVDAEDEDGINSCFQNLNIAVYDEEVRSRDGCSNKANNSRKTYSGKYQSKPSSNRHGSDGGYRERTAEHPRNSNYSRDRGSGTTFTPSTAFNEPIRQRTTDQFTAEQAEIVDGVIQASKSGRGSHYRVLKINSSASQDEVKKVYRRLALQIHPDKNLHPMSAEAFKVLGSSYDVLKSESRRARYDRRSSYPTTSSNASSRSGHQHRATGSHSYYAREEHDSSNFDHGFFNTSYNPFGGPSRGESSRARRRPRGFGGYYQSSSPFGDNSNRNEGSQQYC